MLYCLHAIQTQISMEPLTNFVFFLDCGCITSEKLQNSHCYISHSESLKNNSEDFEILIQSFLR